MSEDFIFGDARYKLTISKREKLLLPEKLPLETDMVTIRNHTLKVISNIEDNSYIDIRDAACTRVTLFNGRRYICILLSILLYTLGKIFAYDC